MKLQFAFTYEIEYLPTKKHKTTRRTCMEEMMDLVIPELTEEEFPLAFEVSRMESVYPGAKNYQDFAQFRDKSEYRLFTQQIRKHQGKLYKEVFNTYGAGISTLHADPETYILESLQKWTYSYAPIQDLPYEKGISVIITSEKEIRKKKITIATEKYKIFDGTVWRLCSEPCYEVSYSPAGAFVDILFSSSEKLLSFQYSANEREQLTEDLKIHQEKYHLQEDEVHFSCMIKTINDTKVQHYHPRTLQLSVFCQAHYDTCIELPKEFVGNLEDAVAYASMHLEDIPLGTLNYIPDSDELDTEGCFFV